MFDSNGTHIGSVGRRGSGLGEVDPTGINFIRLGPNGRVYVFQGRNRVNVISPSLPPSRENRIQSGVVYSPHSLRNGGIIINSNIPTPERIGHTFHVVDTAGTIVGSFGANRSAGGSSGGGARGVAGGAVASAASVMQFALSADERSVWYTTEGFNLHHLSVD